MPTTATERRQRFWGTSTKYDKDLIKQLDHILKESTYKEDTFKELTGKSLDDLNTEWLASLRATAKAGAVARQVQSTACRIQKSAWREHARD